MVIVSLVVVGADAGAPLRWKIKYEKTIRTKMPIITDAMKFFVIGNSITQGLF